MILAGCTSKTNNNESLVSDTTSVITSSQDNTETSQADKQNASPDSTSTERSETTPDTSSASSADKKPPTETKTENNYSESSSSVKPPATESTTDKKPTVSDTTSSTTLKPPTPNSDVVTPQKATAQDADKIAEKMVAVINEYRNNEGVSNATVLPGLTEYAKYRSRQLVTNFAHDTFDERAAATALQYGKYVDPSIHGLTDEPYYTANAREAIAKTDYGGTIDQVAAYLSRLVKNSASHWEYVGGARYKYIAIGVTYQNGVWYCDIAMSSVNTDN